MMVGQQVDTMADPKDLAKLKEGVEAWNEWRHHSFGLTDGLREADLRGFDLEGADLSELFMPRVNLAGCNLFKAKLCFTDLMRSDLRGANLTLADFLNAGLYEANLGEANLSLASFHSTVFIRSDLTGATLHSTIFADTDLSTVKGLDTVKHQGPSTIGLDTIYRSKGKLSEQFLRGCGVPEDFIVYAKSLTTNPVDFYSCFISYSSKDDAFATELHGKLQAQQVRCWKDSEDLKIGDKFQDVIENAIRLHDKLLVVLSENSVSSPWVEREVQAAFENENRQGSAMLFPVRLDDAVMDCQRAWAADIRRTRHIGDFRKWTDHDSFQKSLDRLLRDLKSQDSKPK
jgi:hypothetical protein